MTIVHPDLVESVALRLERFKREECTTQQKEALRDLGQITQLRIIDEVICELGLMGLLDTSYEGGASGG